MDRLERWLRQKRHRLLNWTPGSPWEAGKSRFHTCCAACTQKSDQGSNWQQPYPQHKCSHHSGDNTRCPCVYITMWIHPCQAVLRVILKIPLRPWLPGCHLYNLDLENNATSLAFCNHLKICSYKTQDHPELVGFFLQNDQIRKRILVFGFIRRHHVFSLKTKMWSGI